MKSSLAWSSCCFLMYVMALASGAISCGPSRTDKAPAQPAQAAKAEDPDYCVTPPKSSTGALQPSVATASVTSSTAAPPAAASIEQGRTLFLSYGCAACHGKEGRGDGIVAASLNPGPRNFHDPSSYKLGASAAIIARTIGDGITASSMPAYPQIPVEEREQIASFVVSLQKKP